MTLTRPYKDTLFFNIRSDSKFANALLVEAIDVLLAGDVQTGKAVLRDYINATIGFTELSARTGTPSKSLMRMFSPSGNPTARALFAAIRELQAASGVVLELKRTA
jgi:DNA-binding phage protein